ncbi:hypothetical protein KSI01_14810 [Kurthia sibirica]|nr:hypothetical protein KSI01_14810 [Kurthia sibirica]
MVIGRRFLYAMSRHFIVKYKIIESLFTFLNSVTEPRLLLAVRTYHFYTIEKSLYTTLSMS